MSNRRDPESKDDSVNWRERVQGSLQKRRQKPEDIRKSVESMSKKVAAPLPIRLPSLSAKIAANAEARAEESGKRKTGIIESPTKSSFKRAKAVEDGDSKTQDSAMQDAGETKDDMQDDLKSTLRRKLDRSLFLDKIANLGIARDTVFDIPPPNAENLYKPVRSATETLPLELFDQNELDPTPTQWIQTSIDKHNGEGVPAKAPFYEEREFTWLPCRVISHDDATSEFTVEFQQPRFLRKKLKRLSILFNDEDPAVFKQRVEQCQRLREEALIFRRYQVFINSQKSSSFSPIQQAALHGIVSRLMGNAERLVMARQGSVESLLLEVRDEYNHSMKQAIVEHARRDPVENAKIEALNLPPVPEKSSVPFLAVVDTPARPSKVSDLIGVIGSQHFTHQREATLVVLALYRSWSKLCKESFLEVDTTRMTLPLSLYEYQDIQEGHIARMMDRMVNDWRAMVINLIRDHLNGVFKLYVNELEEYNQSVLRRFLRMVSHMLRHQVCVLAEDSVNAFVRLFLEFKQGTPASRGVIYRDFLAKTERGVQRKKEDRNGLPRVQWTQSPESAEKKEAKEVFANPAEHLEQYLKNPQTLYGASLNPLFVFKITMNSGPVVFLPTLENIESTLMTLINIPSKLQSLQQIDNEVVPLLSIPEMSLCSHSTVPLLFEHVENAKSLLREIVAENLVEPRRLAALYQSYSDILNVDVDDYVASWFNFKKDTSRAAGNPKSTMGAQGGTHFNFKPIETKHQPAGASIHTLAETRAEIQRFTNIIYDVQHRAPSEVSFRLIKVECGLVKEQLIAKAREICSKLLEGLASEIRNQNNTITAQFEEMLARIRMPSTNVKELDELKQRSRKIEAEEIPRLQQELQLMQSKMKITEEFNYNVARKDFNLSWSVVRYPQLVMETLEETKMNMEIDNAKFQKQLQEEQGVFQTDLEEMNKEVTSLLEFGVAASASLSQIDLYSSRVENLEDKMKKAADQVASFHQRDVIFGDTPTDYNELTELRKKFRPHFQLWSTTASFMNSQTNWMIGPFIDLDVNQIEKDVVTWYKLMYKLEKELAAEGNCPKPAKTAEDMRKKINEFKEYVPVIRYLRSPGLKRRHWESLSNLLSPNRSLMHGDENQPKDLTLTQLLNLDIQRHKVAIEDICTSAMKEHMQEQLYDRMTKDWKDVKFELEGYKATGSYIMKKSEDIMTLMDDHIMKTQAMRASPYIKPIEGKVRKWEKRLLDLSRIMEEWLNTQKTWMYLEPIFGSEDIMRAMPKEGSKFKLVDTVWRKTMEECLKNPNVMDFISGESGGGEGVTLLKTWQECNERLDVIVKNLNLYLDSKRMAFPRFFFLSNDELLSILSQTKDVLAVQPHLNKCFECINTLTFSGDKQIITAMNSVEGESVPFCEKIDPREGPRKGCVEVWLRDVERVMKQSLRVCMRQAIVDYAVTERGAWTVKPAGMIMLAVSQIYWTQEVTTALLTGGAKGLADYRMKLNNQISDIVALVRGQLSRVNRCSIEALIVVDVHARDVLTKMCESNVNKETDFDWLAQMRYYWEDGDRSTGKPLPFGKEGCPDGNLRVRIINASQDYGYEYLGNTARLVITPLTDRCYRTLMSAVHLCLGGAPEGPAGTGKTETVKDLAKAVAIACVVFIGSDGINWRNMAKLFKGLAASGAWCCFDEFNRIEAEVLSVIAQQILTIQQALSAKKTQFLFDNVIIPLIPTCCTFITMNPSTPGMGYAGRSELPDNLKALFRAVAMMIPDYALIAEIVLYSCGYTNAKVLAGKIVACLRLSSEQLSSQEHYDFGMRTLKSVLTACGKLKQAFPDLLESYLCLRAICDCNVPKFVVADLPLFEGITRDLFPEVDFKPPDRSDIIKSVQDVMRKHVLQPVPIQVTKCIELYDTFTVRHGLMVVGKTYAGKSWTIRALGEALTRLAKMPENAGKYFEVVPAFLNPKSVTPGQLYGIDDPNTHEWMDGVVPIVMRELVGIAKQGKWAWMVFDGPVDAVWIENMNTVLDDNKKLCLASGEQIKLLPGMTMVFETEDLAVASPATVSRCGMVFLEPRSLGWRPVTATWLQKLPQSTMAQFVPELRSMFEWLVPPCLEFCLKSRAMIPYLEIGQVLALTKLMSCLIDEYKPAQEDAAIAELQSVAGEDNEVDAEGNPVEKKVEAAKPVPPMNEGEWTKLEALFVFSLIWSLGALTDADGRLQFSKFLRAILVGKPLENTVIAEEFKGRKMRTQFPGGADNDAINLFDFKFNKSTSSWENWMADQPEFKIDAAAEFQNIIVPTIDGVRLQWLMEAYITHNTHMLIVGPTGTGKSVIAKRKILSGLDADIYIPVTLDFSAATGANQTQDIIDGKLERRRIGVLGPPPNKRCVIMIDDLNMPARQKEGGCQPAIEILRQWMDYGGWYDRKVLQFKQLVDIQFLAAMGPPGGGRNPVTNRYLRHFCTATVDNFDNESLKRIFNTIVGWWMEPFSGKVRGFKTNVVEAVVSVYNASMKELLPTPRKCHYTFNLRDMSKVFQGILSGTPEDIKDGPDLARIWGHECARVFQDRLVDDTDVKWFEKLLVVECEKNFNRMSWHDVLGSKGRRLVYCDFWNTKVVKRTYSEVRDVDELVRTVENFLVDYNNNEKNQMNLVIFQAALEHVCRISRVIRQPFGNALLVGVGGSGRQSLTRLAAFISEYEVTQVEIDKNYDVQKWKENLRDLMRKAGLAGKQCVFLFTDQQIKFESFVEDINNILNNGEVPNLFPPDEFAGVIEGMTAVINANKRTDINGKDATWRYFVQRCKENIHVVVCHSPIGDNFRNRVRMYPSLVNCATIDWFHPWPTDALKSVAQRFLKEVDLDDKIKSGVVEVCVDMQERVLKLSEQFYESLRRYSYVTPTSYLELIRIFRNLFETKREEISSARKRYENGLKKLNETTAEVKSFEQQLNVLKPQLEQSEKETVIMIAELTEKKTQAAENAVLIASDEKECGVQAEEAGKIKAECEEALNEALPVLRSAQAALKVLKKPALDELKSMKVPTAGVLLTMEALCHMCSVPPVMVGEVGKKKPDYWEPSKKVLLSDSKLLDKLQNFDKDNIKPEVMAKVRPFCQNPEFTPAKVAKASQAAESFCKWVTAIEAYDRVYKTVKPRKEALAVAEQKLVDAAANLKIKKDQLKEVTDMVEELERKYIEQNEKKEKLAKEFQLTNDRLVRANQLTGGLSSEKGRWMEKAAQLALDYNNVVGNILISSGVIAYLGIFTSTFRDDCVSQWTKLLKDKKIPCADKFSLNRTLGDPLQIQKWNAQSLPKDEFSVDNSIILAQSLRCGLMIDPQEQANRWIKRMVTEDKKTELKVLKQSDDNFMRVLNLAVQTGWTVLLENVGEKIEPVLEPILTKQIFYQGGRPMIRVGSEIVNMNLDFRLYVTSKLQNPHYTPEISTKVTIINFMVTPEGLEDQMLGKVVELEIPGIEMKRSENIRKMAADKELLQGLEDKILQRLNDVTGLVLDDEELIATLKKSQEASVEIKKRLAQGLQTEEEINQYRIDYQHVAETASNLYFCCVDLSLVDPMYQYSLRWFSNLFTRSVKDAEQHSELDRRIHNIERTFLLYLYTNVCRSLFERDKLLFSLMLQLRVMAQRGEVDQKELRFLLTGQPINLAAKDDIRPNPTLIEAEDGKEPPKDGAKWLSDEAWKLVLYLDHIDAFRGIVNSIADDGKEWKAFFDSADPYSHPLPGEFEALGWLQKLLPLRCLRPDKLIVAIQTLIAERDGGLGKEFITPPGFDLSLAFGDSDCLTPIIFVLSPGVDPITELLKLATTMGYNSPEKLATISLGQGQGEFAEKAISEALYKGTWVLLQNCHLASSWLSALEKLVDEINPQTTNPDFRLWLTSMPSLSFPVSLLQNGVKITNEPPKGIKLNLAASFRMVGENYFDECKKPEPLKKMFFGLCLFHAIVLERRKFGAIGWNIPYEFNEGDISISRTQLRMFLDLYDDIPYVALKYLIGELNYGGRVTDNQDRRTLMVLLEDYVNPKLMADDFKYDADGFFQPPAAGMDLDDWRDFIKNLPKVDNPDLFGMHANVNITTAIKEANALFASALSVQPRTSGGGGVSRDAFVEALSKDILKELPAPYDVEAAQLKFPVIYENSMNTVLCQELIRFNKLTDIVRVSLVNLQKAVKGQVVMSMELEAIANSMFDGKVPEPWSKAAYPSLKPLGAWFEDLKRRLKMYSVWLQEGSPGVYWFSGFFFTQSFLTGILQNYARKYTIPIDTISFDFEVVPEISPEWPEAPKDGCYVHGLFMEGGRWNTEAGHVDEPNKGELYSVMPVVWLKPSRTVDIPTDKPTYASPVYKTSRRAGALSTTGHSTNFIVSIRLNTKNHPSHWVKRGTALLCQLDF